MKNLLVVIGEPGSGKSSLVRAMTDTLSYSIEKKPFWHTIYYDGADNELGAQLGWTPEYGDGKDFAGTDRLASDAVNKAAKWLKSASYQNLIVEGDRLANSRFIDGAMSAGYNVEIVEVVVGPEVAAQRRQARGAQDPTWVKTRVSKVRHLVDEYRPWVIPVDGTIDHDEQLRYLSGQSAVVRAFMEA